MLTVVVYDYIFVVMVQWNLSKLDTLYTGIPSILNMVWGPNSPYSCTTNPFKLQSPLNGSLYLVPRGVSLERGFTVNVYDS